MNPPTHTEHGKPPHLVLALFWRRSALFTRLLAPVPLGCTSLRTCHQPFSSHGPRRHSPQQVGLWLSKNSSGAGKTCFRIPNRQVCITRVPCQIAVPTWFYRWTEPLTGITTWALQAWTWSAKICVLVVATPSQLLHRSQIFGGWALQIALWSLKCTLRVEAPTKRLTMLGEVDCPFGIFFATGGTRGSERPLLMVWPCPGGGAV